MIDGRARKYTNGFCDAMAIALHDAGKGDLGVWTLWHRDEDDELFPEPVHMVVVDPVTTCWQDATGVYQEMPDSLLSLIGDPVKVTLEPCSRDEALYVFTMEGVTDEQIAEAREFAIGEGLIAGCKAEIGLRLGNK